MPRPFALPLLLACCSLLSAKTHVADRYDVRVRVLRDASLDIAETVRFTFRGGAFTYVSREIPKRELDRILDVAASMDGAPADASIEETGRRVRVRWRFHAPADSSHVFTLSYRVKGAIREEPGRAFLHWRAIPEDRDYRILAAGIAIDYPARDVAAPPASPPPRPSAASPRAPSSRSTTFRPAAAPLSTPPSATDSSPNRRHGKPPHALPASAPGPPGSLPSPLRSSPPFSASFG
jgi:hypothetical protein